MKLSGHYNNIMQFAHSILKSKKSSIFGKGHWLPQLKDKNKCTWNFLKVSFALAKTRACIKIFPQYNITYLVVIFVGCVFTLGEYIIYMYLYEIQILGWKPANPAKITADIREIFWRTCIKVTEQCQLFCFINSTVLVLMISFD